MIREGQVVLFRFPQTDRAAGKLRPALVLRRLPGPHGDWLVCMISSQLKQQVEDFDEVVRENAPDFVGSGLKTASVIRVGRVAVVEASVLLGAIGEIAPERLIRIRGRLAAWLADGPTSAGPS